MTSRKGGGARRPFKGSGSGLTWAVGTGVGGDLSEDRGTRTVTVPLSLLRVGPKLVA